MSKFSQLVLHPSELPCAVQGSKEYVFFHLFSVGTSPEDGSEMIRYICFEVHRPLMLPTPFTPSYFARQSLFVALLLLAGACPRRIPPAPQHTLGGIPNVGNTCYLNAVMQVLAKLYPEDIFTGNKLKGAKTIADKVRKDQQASSREEAECFYKSFLESINQKRIDPWGKNGQEDAREALEHLLSLCVQESFDVISNFTDSEGKKKNSKADYKVWQVGAQINNNEKENIQPREEISFKDLLEHQWKESHLENLKNLPNGILPIVVVRGIDTKKEPSSIDIQEGEIHSTDSLSQENNPLKQATETKIKKPFSIEIKEEGGKFTKYALKAFILHIKSIPHYKAYIKTNEQWKEYDDAIVTEMNEEQIRPLAEQAYLYFFKRKST